MRIKGLLLIVITLFIVTGCVDSAQSKRNKFDACVINEMQGYWDVRPVREYVPGEPGLPGCKGIDCAIDYKGYYKEVEREVFVEPTLKKAEQSCVYLLD